MPDEALFLRYLYLKYQLYIAIISLNSSKQIPRPKYLKHSGDKARNLPMRIWLPNLANLPPWFRTTLRILQNKMAFSHKLTFFLVLAAL